MLCGFVPRGTGNVWSLELIVRLEVFAVPRETHLWLLILQIFNHIGTKEKYIETKNW